MSEPQSYQVIISSRATRMLVSHAAFLAEVSVDAANNFVEEFEKSANSLQEFPMRCPRFEQAYIPHNKYRLLLFCKRYLMIFQIRDNTVYVDYVVDCRQDYQWLI